MAHSVQARAGVAAVAACFSTWLYAALLAHALPCHCLGYLVKDVVMGIL